MDRCCSFCAAVSGSVYAATGGALFCKYWIGPLLTGVFAFAVAAAARAAANAASLFRSVPGASTEDGAGILVTNGWFMTWKIRCTFFSPKPGHNWSSSLVARAIAAKLPKLFNKLLTSVLLILRIMVNDSCSLLRMSDASTRS